MALLKSRLFKQILRGAPRGTVGINERHFAVALVVVVPADAVPGSVLRMYYCLQQAAGMIAPSGGVHPRSRQPMKRLLNEVRQMRRAMLG